MLCESCALYLVIAHERVLPVSPFGDWLLGVLLLCKILFTYFLCPVSLGAYGRLG